MNKDKLYELVKRFVVTSARDEDALFDNNIECSSNTGFHWKSSIANFVNEITMVSL